jgi:hypothetical protein
LITFEFSLHCTTSLLYILIQITLTLFDSSTYSSILVKNEIPQVANAIPDQRGLHVGTTWSYTFPANSFSDPDGDILTYSATGLAGWMLFSSTTRTFSGRTPIGSQGTTTITVTATDSSGAAASGAFTVTGNHLVNRAS